MDKKQEMRGISLDFEMENGIFVLGKRYYVMTPTYHYLGTLRAVTPTVFVFEEVETVFESGPYEEFFKGRPKDSQKMVGSKKSVIDRAGTHLHETDL